MEAALVWSHDGWGEGTAGCSIQDPLRALTLPARPCRPATPAATRTQPELEQSGDSALMHTPATMAGRGGQGNPGGPQGGRGSGGNPGGGSGGDPAGGGEAEGADPADVPVVIPGLPFDTTLGGELPIARQQHQASHRPFPSPLPIPFCLPITPSHRPVPIPFCPPITPPLAVPSALSSQSSFSNCSVPPASPRKLRLVLVRCNCGLGWCGVIAGWALVRTVSSLHCPPPPPRAPSSGGGGPPAAAHR
jgi:hypothetical protein